MSRHPCFAPSVRVRYFVAATLIIAVSTIWPSSLAAQTPAVVPTTAGANQEDPSTMIGQNSFQNGFGSSNGFGQGGGMWSQNPMQQQYQAFYNQTLRRTTQRTGSIPQSIRGPQNGLTPAAGLALPAAMSGEATGVARFGSGVAGQGMGSGLSAPETPETPSGASLVMPPAPSAGRLQLRLGTRRMTPYQMCLMDGGCPGLRSASTTAGADSTPPPTQPEPERFDAPPMA